MGRDRSRPGPVAPWHREFRGPLSGVSCVFCGCTSRTVVAVTTPSGTQVGACEACSAHLCWTWRELPPDVDPAPPSERPSTPTVVKVVLTRLAKVGGRPADPGHPASYEVLMVKQPGGDLDLPSADVGGGESVEAASARALAELGFGTWAGLVETLYVALTPRGRLAAVTLATAYTEYLPALGLDPAPAAVVKSRGFRPWPPWDKSDASGLYLALRDVWPMRIAQHLGREPRTFAVTTMLRRGATEYVQMQHDLGDPSMRAEVDTSVAEVLRGGMSEDELVVARQIRELEEADAAGKSVEEPEESEEASEVVESAAGGELPEDATSDGEPDFSGEVPGDDVGP